MTNLNKFYRIHFTENAIDRKMELKNRKTVTKKTNCQR